MRGYVAKPGFKSGPTNFFRKFYPAEKIPVIVNLYTHLEPASIYLMDRLLNHFHTFICNEARV